MLEQEHLDSVLLNDYAFDNEYNQIEVQNE